MKSFSRGYLSWKLNTEEALCVHRVYMKSAVTMCIRILLWPVWLMVATKLLRQTISWLLYWSIWGWIALWCCRFWNKNQLRAESNAVTGKREKASLASVLLCVFPDAGCRQRAEISEIFWYILWHEWTSRGYFWWEVTSGKRFDTNLNI